MRLTVVGCAPAYTGRSGNASSCYLVEHASTRIVLDLGQGAFAEMWRYAPWPNIAAVFVSHMHADHNVDLIPLRHWVRYENRGYGPALYGPTELRQRLGDYQADPDFLSDLKGEKLTPRTYAVGDLRIEAAPVTHIPDSWAFRVAPAGRGSGLVYSGDCSNWRDLVPLIRRGDTLLCEAALGGSRAAAGPHLRESEAREAARTGGATTLVLTHVLDRFRDTLSTPADDDLRVLVAEPGLQVQLTEGTPHAGSAQVE